MKIKKSLIILIIIILVVFYSSAISDIKPIEEYDIAAGIGNDLDKNAAGGAEYTVPYSVYNFGKENQTSAMMKPGTAKTIGETRENRQLITDKAFLIGNQRIMLFGEELARSSIDAVINILFSNPKMNDRSYMVVSKGRTEDVLNYKIEGYSSSSQYLEDMIRNSARYNFFSKKYTLLNAYMILGTEGRNLVLPYVEITDSGLVMTGMAMFNGPKMVNKLNMEDSRVMNMLRENSVKGMITLDQNSNKFINYYGTTKRKVTCNKKGDNYEFIINLKLNGDIITNTLYSKLDKKFKKDFEQKVSKYVEESCNRFIDIMKNEYKVDFLSLGYYGASKYGWEKVNDWNYVVCNSEIKVQVETAVDRIGRGEY